ncbi:uncharacterized protein LOC144656705 [Oculina patagonica]
MKFWIALLFLHLFLTTAFAASIHQPFKGKQTHEDVSAPKRAAGGPGGQPNRLYHWFGFAVGNLHNTYASWQQAPEWMKRTYQMEMEYLGGDIDSPLSGALKGLVESTVDYAKENPADALKMGQKIAQAANITPDKGMAFAQGFLDTARLE